MSETLGLQIAKRLLAGFFVLIAIIGLAGWFAGDQGGLAGRGIALLFAAVGTWGAIRAWRSATILVETTGVAYRSFLKTRRWAWDEIARFEVREGSVGHVIAWRRRILWVVLTSGKEHRLEELNERLQPKRVSSLNDLNHRLNGLNRTRGRGR